MCNIKDEVKFDYLIVRSPDKRKLFGYGVYDVKYETTGMLDKAPRYYLKRDKRMPYYGEIVRLEEEFFQYNDKLLEEKDLSPSLMLMLFFVFVIPMFLYLFIHNAKQKKAIRNNVIINKELDRIKKEVSNYLEQTADYVQLVTINTCYKIDNKHYLIDGDVCVLLNSGEDESTLLYILDNREYKFDIDNDYFD